MTSLIPAAIGGASLAYRYGPQAMKYGAAAGKALAAYFNRRRKRGDYQKGRETLKSSKELKALDTTVNQAFKVSGGPPPISTLNYPVVGAELYQRVGRKIYMKSIHFRGVVFNTAAAAQDFIRIVILYDANPNAAAPAYTDILQDSTAGSATSFFSHLNLTNRQRFKVLKDWHKVMPLTTAANAEASVPEINCFSLDWFIPLKGLETVYNGTNGGSIADIVTGAIVIMTYASNTNLWQLNGTFRLRYYD